MHATEQISTQMQTTVQISPVELTSKILALLPCANKLMKKVSLFPRSLCPSAYVLGTDDRRASLANARDLFLTVLRLSVCPQGASDEDKAIFTPVYGEMWRAITAIKTLPADAAAADKVLKGISQRIDEWTALLESHSSKKEEAVVAAAKAQAPPTPPPRAQADGVKASPANSLPLFKSGIVNVKMQANLFEMGQTTTTAAAEPEPEKIIAQSTIKEQAGLFEAGARAGSNTAAASSPDKIKEITSHSIDIKSLASVFEKVPASGAGASPERAPKPIKTLEGGSLVQQRIMDINGKPSVSTSKTPKSAGAPESPIVKNIIKGGMCKDRKAEIYASSPMLRIAIRGIRVGVSALCPALWMCGA
jgi:hypothetical protein